MKEHRYFIIYKPVDMVSQFVSTHEVRLLGSLDFIFPEGTHAIGRLDKESEGLLLLTTDKKVTSLLFEGESPHHRTYYVQVKGEVSDESIEKLQKGITISAPFGASFTTSPCRVKKLQNPEKDYKALVPLHQNIVNSWLEMELTEGRFHQVRKMVAAIQHKCMRLIRTSIEDLDIRGMTPGMVKELNRETFYEKLKL